MWFDICILIIYSKWNEKIARNDYLNQFYHFHSSFRKPDFSDLKRMIANDRVRAF